MKKLFQLAVAAAILWLACDFFFAPPPGAEPGLDYRTDFARYVGRTLGNWDLTIRELELIIAGIALYCLALGFAASIALGEKGLGAGVNCVVALAGICGCAWLRRMSYGPIVPPVDIKTVAPFCALLPAAFIVGATILKCGVVAAFERVLERLRPPAETPRRGGSLEQRLRGAARPRPGSPA